MSHILKSHRALWQSVMVAAIMDAAKAVKSRARICGHSRAVAIEMVYFHSADWRLLCEMAGASSKPAEIEAFLRSDLVAKTQAEIYRSFGLTKERSELGQHDSLPDQSRSLGSRRKAGERYARPCLISLEQENR